MLIELPGGRRVSTTPPFAWVDTNVMVEMFSFADLMEAKQNGTPAQLEDRRVRMQGSLWMAITLCLSKAFTVSYQHESLRNLTRQLQPGTHLYSWSRVSTFLFFDGGLFDGWHSEVTLAGEEITSATQRDNFMVEQCAKMGMKLFSRDQRALEKARALGVDAVEPQEFADRLCPRGLAEKYFTQRMDAALKLCAEKGPFRDETSLGGVRAVYEYIWKPTGPAPKYSLESLFR
jgi:hypothetical protein